jgi:hypothetical protein
VGPRAQRTRTVSAAQVRSYAAKATEFAEAAASDLRAGRNIAATSLAVHAGINSADAVCGARLGHRAAGDDHDQVLVLLRQAGPDGGEVERELFVTTCEGAHLDRPSGIRSVSSVAWR